MESPPAPDDPDELAEELAALASETMRVEAVDTETGQRYEGVIHRDHWAQAVIERDERR